MNVVKKTAKIEKLYHTCKYRNKPKWEEFVRLPLLTSTFAGESNRNDIETWAGDLRKIPFPFPAFRFYIDPETGGRDTIWGFAWEEFGEEGIDKHWIMTQGDSSFWSYLRVVNGEYTAMSHHGGVAVPMFGEIGKMALEVMLLFCYLYDSGGYHRAIVRPDKSKSVQWVQKNSWITLIERSHPANKPNIANGQAVQITARDIQRAAHYRRAHFRVLRSAKFRNMQGRKIRVKSAWVGPTEWRHGGQVYEIRINNSGEPPIKLKGGIAYHIDDRFND